MMRALALGILLALVACNPRAPRPHPLVFETPANLDPTFVPGDDARWRGDVHYINRDQCIFAQKFAGCEVT